MRDLSSEQTDSQTVKRTYIVLAKMQMMKME